jgi:hypothetical protein
MRMLANLLLFLFSERPDVVGLAVENIALRQQPAVLRSKTPDLVQQESCGLMHEAALKVGGDPGAAPWRQVVQARRPNVSAGARTGCLRATRVPTSQPAPAGSQTAGVASTRGSRTDSVTGGC